MPLSILEIKHAKSGMHLDSDGLYLVVQATGTKSWVFRYQLAGKRREMGLGSLTKVDGKAARAMAAQARVLVGNGKDPLEERKVERARVQAEVVAADKRVVTFKDVATEYIAQHRAGWRNPKHAQQWQNTLETYAYPDIGEIPVGDVDTSMVLKILKSIWTKKTETASRVRSRIELILSYAKAKKLRDGENAAQWRGHLDMLLPKPTKVRKVRHHAALPYAQAPTFFKALVARTGVAARALEFAILTAARSGEVRLAEWGEIDLDKGIWTVPADRMKAQKEHRVPLSSHAMDLLGTQPKVDGTELIFPGVRMGRPLSDMSLAAVLKRMEFGEFTVHGFRSTFRDWTAEATHFPHEMAETALAHTLTSKVEAAYRRGDMIEKRREMMQAWSDYLNPAEEASESQVAG